MGYCLLLNHSFPTNPNKITNCFKLILFYLQLYNYICSMRSSILIFDLLAHRTQSSSVIWVFAAQMILSSLFGWVFGILLTTVLGIPFDRCDAALPTSSKTTKSVSKNINGGENRQVQKKKKQKRNQKNSKDSKDIS